MTRHQQHRLLFWMALLAMIIFLCIFSPEQSFAACKHPWLFSDDRVHQCYMDDNWLPQEWDIVKDFSERISRPHYVEEFRIEHIINHWMISYELIDSTEGDCGWGEYRIIERNSLPIPSQPKFKYGTIDIARGDCGGPRRRMLGFSLEVTRGDPRGLEEIWPTDYNYDIEEKWIPGPLPSPSSQPSPSPPSNKGIPAHELSRHSPNSHRSA